MGRGKLKSPLKFPKQIRFIIGNEAAERFSFYGMRAILTMFMIQNLLFGRENAVSTYHLFVSACYFVPLFGGYIADRFLGKYKTILYLSFVYCLGHLTLAVFEGRAGLFTGLGLIALGSGGIKPCVSAFVGDQFDQSSESLLARAFELFYFSINFGSFFATLLIPFLLQSYGPRIAFGIPGGLMGIATLIFWLGRQHYVNVAPVQTEKNHASLIRVALYSLTQLHKRKRGEHWMNSAKKKFPPSLIEGYISAMNVFGVFITVSVFWALFDQQGSTWTIQADKLDRQFSLFGRAFEILPSQVQALNPIFVMLIIPLFSFVIYPLSAKFGYQLTPLRKMSIGMYLTFLSFVVAYFIERGLEAGLVVSLGWQVLGYVIITMSEVLVSITGLEFAYTQAPPSMKGTVMSLWLLTIVIGDLLTAYVSKINVFTGAHEFLFHATLMFAMAILFMILATRYKVRDFVQVPNFKKAM